MDFDTEKFIKEVQKRPAIWKYSDQIQRYRDWKEMAESYGGKSDDDTKHLAQRLQKKWRNIRDCFVKTHKGKTGKLKPGKKPIEYAFYNNLLFLLESECMSSNNSEDTPSNTANSDNNASISENTASNNSDTALNTSENSAINIYDDGFVVKTEATESDPISLEQSWTRKRKRFESDVASTEATNEKEDDDAKLFFLSLVKEFNKIPEHLRIQAKIDLLKVIKDAQFSGC